LKILEALGVSPDVPCAPVRGMSVRAQAGEVAAWIPGRAIGKVVRRIEVDHALAQAAMARGVDGRDGVRVGGGARRASGATVSTSAGPIEARIVVGADGVGSAVRKAMGLSAGTLRAQVLELDTEMVVSDRDRRLLHFDVSQGDLDGYAWDFPTLVSGEPLVC